MKSECVAELIQLSSLHASREPDGIQDSSAGMLRGENTKEAGTHITDLLKICMLVEIEPLSRAGRKERGCYGIG